MRNLFVLITIFAVLVSCDSKNNIPDEIKTLHVIINPNKFSEMIIDGENKVEVDSSFSTLLGEGIVNEKFDSIIRSNNEFFNFIMVYHGEMVHEYFPYYFINKVDTTVICRRNTTYAIEPGIDSEIVIDTVLLSDPEIFNSYIEARRFFRTDNDKKNQAKHNILSIIKNVKDKNCSNQLLSELYFMVGYCIFSEVERYEYDDGGYYITPDSSYYVASEFVLKSSYNREEIVAINQECIAYMDTSLMYNTMNYDAHVYRLEARYADIMARPGIMEYNKKATESFLFFEESEKFGNFMDKSEKLIQDILWLESVLDDKDIIKIKAMDLKKLKDIIAYRRG